MWRITCILLLCVCSSVAFSAEKPRLIKANIPAAKLNALRLNVDVGSVTVTAAHDGTVHVKVKLTPRHHSGFSGMFHWSDTGSDTGKTARLTGTKLKRSREAHALVLSLAYPAGVDHGDVKAEWHIAMPARLHFKANVDAGMLDLRGIAGGVDLKMDAGKMSIKVPRGVIHAEVDAGKITAVTATRDRGDISLASDIGEAELHMPGAAQGESKQRSGMGDSIHVPGEGRDDMILKTDVGKVELTVQAPSHGR